jgi:hypothetical protein
MREVLDAAAAAYTELKNLCVWTKTNGGTGSFYRSQHELVFVFKNGHAPHVDTVEFCRFGRDRSNVWPYAGVNAFGKERDVELGMHPSLKPLALVADAILDCSKRGAIVLDAFAGSGPHSLPPSGPGEKGLALKSTLTTPIRLSGGSRASTASRPSTPGRTGALRRSNPSA